MIALETKRWLRSQRFFLVVLVFLFSGVSSPLFTAYSQELFESMGETSGVRIIAEDPTWQDLILSYFGNSSQLALLLACYLTAWGCCLGSDDRLRIFYTSRVNRYSQIVGPRLVVSSLCVLVGAAAGAAVALYETAVLIDDTDIEAAAIALTVQGLTMVAFSLLSACLACWTNAPFVSAVAIAAAVFAGSLVESVSYVQDWSPTILTNPAGLVGDDGVGDFLRPMAVLAALVVLAVGSVVLRRARTPLRQAPRRATGSHRPGPDGGGNRDAPQSGGEHRRSRAVPAASHTSGDHI